MASVPKKIKSDEDDIFRKFHSVYLKEQPRFIEMLDQLKQKSLGLGALKIGSCNGADPVTGNCFTHASCGLLPTDATFAFGNFFIEAFRILKNFTRDNIIPEDDCKKMVLSKLLAFLMNKDIQEPLFALEMYCSDETELTVMLAFHLFSQLSLSPAFTVDDSKSCKPKRCPCNKRHGKVVYGDTSIGNPDVWYGRLDLIMEGAEVIIETLDGDEESLRDVESVIEVKKKGFNLNNTSLGSSIAQVAAETIVYSFFYRKLHPENANSLIPCIGVCFSNLLCYFYDSVNDVMLGSTEFSLTGAEPSELNIVTILIVWMILNHKYLCNGLSNITLDEDVPKSGFLKLAEPKINIYRNELHRTDVKMKRRAKSVDPQRYPTSKFIVSKELESI